MKTETERKREKLEAELTRTRASVVALRLAIGDAYNEPELFAGLGDAEASRELRLEAWGVVLRSLDAKLRELKAAV